MTQKTKIMSWTDFIIPILFISIVLIMGFYGYKALNEGLRSHGNLKCLQGQLEMVYEIADDVERLEINQLLCNNPECEEAFETKIEDKKQLITLITDDEYCADMIERIYGGKK